MPKHVTCTYVRQAEALGLGHAVLCAKAVVGDEPFAVILADDLIDAQVPVLKQMVDIYEQRHRSVIAVQNVPREDTGSYGIIQGDRRRRAPDAHDRRSWRSRRPEQAPSTLAVVGRYILTPRIIHAPGARAARRRRRDPAHRRHRARCCEEETVLAYEFEGTRYDCGSKLGYLQANVMYRAEAPRSRRGVRPVPVAAAGARRIAPSA